MGKSNLREAAVAGQFYPSSPLELKDLISSFLEPKTERKDVIACMLPHAGYIYSGRVACQTVSCINIPEKVILLGPNHTGNGPEFSIMCEGSWQTPLGELKIAGEVAQELVKQSKFLKADRLAHASEHSLEVELPILQYFKNDFEIVPITVFSDDVSALKTIGQEIARVISGLKIKDSTLIVASSDMTHYEPKLEAEKKDREAIQAILALDEDGLMAKIRRLNITMCGYAPVIIMLSAAKALGARKAQLVSYQTSGEISGDFSSVVGYAGIIVS